MNEAWGIAGDCRASASSRWPSIDLHMMPAAMVNCLTRTSGANLINLNRSTSIPSVSTLDFLEGRKLVHLPHHNHTSVQSFVNELKVR